MLELKHLNSFLTLAEEGHVGRAAARLGIEQSPLSRRLQSLEAALGMKLFDRTPKGITLTPAGRDFYAGIRPLLQQLEDTKQRALATARGEKGRLSIACTVASAYDGFLAECLQTFASVRPSVTMSISVMGTAESFGALREGSIDVALTHSPPPPAEGFKHVLLMSDPFAVALPTSLYPASGPRKLIDLADIKWIMLPRSASSAFYDSFVAACERAGFSPKIGYETQSSAVAMSLVSAGLGALLKSSRQARMAPTGVRFDRLADYERQVETFLVWSPDSIAPTALLGFIETMISRANAIMREGALSSRIHRTLPRRTKQTRVKRLRKSR